MKLKNSIMEKTKLLLVLFILTFLQFSCVQKKDVASFKFIVWGDSQFENIETFNGIVQETELLKPAFVIHVGDMIHGYTYDPENARRQWKHFKEQISPLSCPFYPTPGNHDVTTAEIEPIYQEAWSGKYYYSFDYGNSHFIILDAFLNQQFDTIPEEELNWLEKDLETNKNADNIFISFHSPLYLKKEDKNDWLAIQNLLERYSIKAVFSGHYHIYDYRIKNNINYFCLNSSGGMEYYNHLAGYSHHFLVVSIDGKNVNFAVVENGMIYPPDAVPPGQSSLSKAYLEREKTIQIPDPSKKSIDVNISIPIENRTDQTRTFSLTWDTNDKRWIFQPWFTAITLKPEEKRLVNFNIVGPNGNFNRTQLPKIRVDTPFQNSAGWKTTLSFYHKLFHPPEIEAKQINEKITLDGKIEEPVWDTTPSIIKFHTDIKGTLAPENNSVKILYNRENLYIGIKGEEPNPDGLIYYAYGELPLVFGDDDFELYFDTNRDKKTFYRLMVNPKGTTLCSGPDGLFSFNFDVKTYIGKNYWSAEFEIPFSELEVNSPKFGNIWGFNVRRHRQQAVPSQRDWSKMNNHPYQPQYFGLLKFE